MFPYRGPAARQPDGPASAARRAPAPWFLWLLAVLLLPFVTACSGAAPPPTRVTPVASASQPVAEAPAAPRPASPVVNAGTDPGEITPILATKTLETGRQRVAFLLSGKQALIKAPEAAVTATYLGGAAGAGAAAGETRQARFHLWPFGIRGAYSVEFDFDRPGLWRLDIAVDDGGFSADTSLEVAVTETSPVPGIGSRPPLSETATVTAGADVTRLTTDYTPDPDLYRLSVAAAVASPRPAVIVFASPAFCTSPACGPQVDTVSELKAAYQNRADFVHVEIYARPQEIQGDLNRADLADAVEEWGFTQLPYWFNESWVFILNDQGRVEQRFEGFATLTELEAALKQTLGES